ncbi:AB1gp32 [Acinetobacter phage AB1]|uniref:AB1gp32 n=1 Tax=Acinetobacter phage AB1 TaxID=889876 RepID=E2GLX0_9CAUD|nr:AB1gp32 [Acinetobacter phage AB1]ADO14403.1 AB1gp32 [Acinetobacter phage AB1]
MPAASQLFELARPPNNILLRALVVQNDLNTGLRLGFGFGLDVCIEII